MKHVLVPAMLAAAFASASTLAAPADLIPVEAFARHPELSMVRLSPDGEHIALRADLDNGKSHAVMIYSVSDLEHPFMLRMQPNELPNNIVWVSNNRIIIEKAKQLGALDAPLATGEIITTNIDGKRQDYLYGYDAPHHSSRGATRNGDQGSGFFDGRPVQANDHFYMRAYAWGTRNQSSLYDVDAGRNTRHLIGDINLEDMEFLVAPDGTARYAFGRNDNWEFVVFRKTDDRWHQIKVTSDSGSFVPENYAPDGKRIYAWFSPDGGPSMLVEQNEDGTDRRILAKDDFSSVGDIQWTPTPSAPFAFIPSTGLPITRYIDSNLPVAKLHMALRLKFPGEYVNFINFSEDGAKLLFSVASDKDPGTYYLIDTHTYKVTKLFSPAQWINPSQMAERRAIRFKASDGMELEGFVTIPPGTNGQNLPMVLLPHGGPIGERDDWFFDPDAQFLASRGYLVLQVNYRGSSGRGANFQEEGYLKWGTRIQADLIDGVRWAIQEHMADPQRICVYGGSFGGYSAMMSVIRAPGLFKCAVGYAGIYDLQMMYNKGDVQERKSGRSYLRTVIGKNDADLDANSPDKLADKITVPVFLAHGEDDERAPFAQAKSMRAALEAAHKPYEWMSKPGEAHGFYDQQNQIDFYNALQAFLEKYIGKGA